MINLLMALLLVQDPAAPELKTRFWELKEGGTARAIVLVHGLRVQVFDESKPNEALAPEWQNSDSTVVRSLSKHGTVFGFAYSQNRKVQEIPPSLLPHVRKLKADGYPEIVLVGFSAGALIARQFVEDHPDAGVRRVIQICPPNGGSDLGKLDRAARESQEVFIRSLRKEERETFLRERGEKGVKVPEGVEFVVVLGSVAGSGDGVVSRQAQWTSDLRDQGIPVARVELPHCF
jgi:pimeloyl-ACP methyl ester carboxylesterase